MPNALEASRQLVAALGPTLVSGMAGSPDREAATAWASGNGPDPTEAEMDRLQVAYAVWSRVAARHGGDVARTWFLGSNPWLGDDAPVEAIMEGRFVTVMVATSAMIRDVPPL